MCEVKLHTERTYYDRKRITHLSIGEVELHDVKNEVNTEDGRKVEIDRPVGGNTDRKLHLEVYEPEYEQYRVNPGRLEDVVEVRDGEVYVDLSELEEV